MELIKTISVALLAGAVAAVGVVFLAPKDSNGVPTLGAISGPEISSPYLAWGGIFNYAGSKTLAQATTTVCAIQSPIATSTLENFQIRFDSSSTTASVITIAKASTAFATTTSIGTDYNIAANAQAFIQASSSPQAGAANVFGPNQWIVVGMKGGTGTFSPTGVCQANWISS